MKIDILQEDAITLELEDENGNALNLKEIARFLVYDPNQKAEQDLILLSEEGDEESLYLFKIIDEDTLEPVTDESLINAALEAVGLVTPETDGLE